MRYDPPIVTPTVVSFYTSDWLYRQHAERLRNELYALAVPHVILQVQSTGSYLGNTRRKPEFLLRMRQQQRGPLLWVDVDAGVLERPTFGVEGDVAMRPITSLKRRRPWHVGTIWLNDNPLVEQFLSAWALECNRELVTDESALNHMLMRGDFPDLRITPLPPEYFVMEQRGKTPLPGTVVLHRTSAHPAKTKGEQRLAELDERRNG